MVSSGSVPASSQRVSINGKYFVLADDVTVRRIPAEGEAFRIQGTQRRLDNALVNKLMYPWNLGVGWNRMRRDPPVGNPRGVGGLRDSTMETRFSIAELAILHEAQTTGTPIDHPKKYIHFLGDLWGLFEEDYDTGEITNCVSRKYGASSDNWTGGGNIITPNANALGSRIFDAVVHKSKIYVIGTAPTNDDDTVIWSSADAVTWAEDSSSGATSPGGGQTIARRNNFDDDMGRALSFGNTLMFAIREVDNVQVKVQYSTDAWVNTSSGAVIPTAEGPKAFVLWKNPLTSPPTISPILVLSDGVYRVDSGGATFDLIFPLDGDPNNGRWATVGLDGDLYIGLGSGSLIALHAELTGGLTIRTVGPPGDGFVSARQGHVNYILAPSLPWLFVSYGGHAASKKASIWAIEYTQRINPDDGSVYQTWHHIYQEDTANLDIVNMGYSTEDDSTPRLHFAVEGASVSELFHLEHPDKSGAASGVAIKRQASGFMEFADDDNGDPHADTNVLTGRLDADDLSSDTDGEYVEHEYGLDGAAWTNVSNFGNYVSGDKVLFFGKTQQNTSSSEAGTPVGVSAKRSRHRLFANRASTNTNTPKIREFQVEAYSKANIITGFNVPINIQATADMRGNTEVETIWNDIETIQNSVILVPFIFAEDGSGAAKTYFVRGDRASEGSAPLVNPTSVGLGGTLDKTQRGGIYNLPLNEVIV